MASDTLREKEKIVAGIRKYLVVVAWYGMEQERRRDAVFVEADSYEEAKKTACALIEEDIKDSYYEDDENPDLTEHNVHWQSVKPVDEIEYPSIK